MECRFCGEQVNHVLIDLGQMPPANGLLTQNQLNEPEVFYPLRALVCHNCWLVQTLAVIPCGTQGIFNSSYPYYSSQSPANVAHAREFAATMVTRFRYGEAGKKKPYDWLVLEIGSNDGYLLRWFKGLGIKTIGMDPCSGPAEVARSIGIATICDFFGEKTARQYNFDTAQADLICGINVLAHQSNINDFAEGLRIALAPDGVIVMEFPHLMRLINDCLFDTIYHEHFLYLSLGTTSQIFTKHGLEIFDVEEIPKDGGSLRIFAQHAGAGQSKTRRLFELLERETTLRSSDRYFHFEERAEKIRRDLFCKLAEITADNRLVMGYGAAAKGATLLNYCGIHKDLVCSVVDRSPYKQYRFLPGSHIPIVEEDEISVCRPEYVLILPWNLKDEIMAQLKYIRDWGGKFIIPMPKLEVL